MKDRGTYRSEIAIGGQMQRLQVRRARDCSGAWEERKRTPHLINAFAGSEASRCFRINSAIRKKTKNEAKRSQPNPRGAAISLLKSENPLAAGETEPKRSQTEAKERSQRRPQIRRPASDALGLGCFDPVSVLGDRDTKSERCRGLHGLSQPFQVLARSVNNREADDLGCRVTVQLADLGLQFGKNFA